MWKDFGPLCFRESEEYCGYVRCYCCLKLLKHHRAISGTMHLKQLLQEVLVLQLPQVQAKLLLILTAKVGVCQKVLKKNY